MPNCRLAADGITVIEATMGKEPVQFFPAENGKYAALIGADVEAKPGVAKVADPRLSRQRRCREEQTRFASKPRPSRKESFTVAAGFDQFTPEVSTGFAATRSVRARLRASSAKRYLGAAVYFRPCP